MVIAVSYRNKFQLSAKVAALNQLRSLQTFVAGFPGLLSFLEHPL
jgi:hypothetical protein